ncbi:hypothetical protein Mapa_008958 [Marchantia paleacea]|nr:hypothetical protein Mapa_008958 [Marchantia paleacea]
MPSQEDGGDEIVWKVSPTAARLQAATVGGSEPTLTGQRRKVLQPCTNSATKSEAAHGIWSTASIQGTSNTKKKKSPGMAGKLELWLRSTQKGPTNKPKAILEFNVDILDEEKENVQNPGYSPNIGVQQGLTPRYEKQSVSVQQRPSTSSQRRPLSAKKAGSTSLPTVTAKRKKLLELLDRVDSEIKRTPTSRTLTRNSDLPLHEKQISPERTNVFLDQSQVKRRQFNITNYLDSQASGDKCLEVQRNDSPAETLVKKEEKVVHTSVQIEENREEVFTKLSRTNDDNLQLPHVVENLTALDVDSNSASNLYEEDHLDPPLLHNEKERSIHFLVLEVSEGEHKVDSKVTYPQKTLRLLDENCGLERFACLRDSWSYSDVTPGDTVNVIGEFDEANNCVIDREHNLLIINPDILISGSKVGSSFACPRRAVLDERMKTNEWSYAALIGTMLHQLFQGALRSRQPFPADLESEAKLIVQRNLDGLYAAEVSEREALSKLVEAIPTILTWWQQHVRAEETIREFEPVTRGRHVGSISEILDIEEMIWSPKYGLKGMIDASVTVKLGNFTLGGEDHIMPLEFKTGKATTGQAGVEHRAQVILYTLLMSDRYMQAVNSGLLYYLHTNKTQEVGVQQGELVGLIMRRNEHARDLLKASASQTLPSMLQSYQMCQNCRQLDSCAVYHKAQDGVTAESSGLGEVFDKSTNHLTTADLHFFQQWDRLIDLEFRDLLMSHSEIWRMPSKKREELGRCISSLVLSTSPNNSDDQKESAGYFLYTFRRPGSTSDPSNTGDMCTPSSSLQDRPFNCGDYVVLSTESGHTAVAGGIVASLNEVSIVIRLSHRLHNPKRSQISAKAISSQELWRIDKDESASIMATMRFNLLQLFVKNNGDEQRRRLIVGLEAPKFESGPNDDTDPGLTYVRSAIDLNEDQRHAINRILSAKDYTLILGMPGTGKTSTIVHTVVALMRRNLSVLLTSYTNSAVDNILLKLKTLGVDFTRVGRSSAVHPELRDKVLGEGKSVTTVEEFASAVDGAQVVGVTCLGISHALFSKRKFDVCIVDEAGQITLPICLGPLRCARRFVLVGDHYQLPPLVRTPEAREDGMAVSLFRRLSEAYPQSSCALQSQYRMCSDIMALSNSLIYGDRLRCGSPQVANATLQLSSTPVSSAWLSQVVKPEQRVLFLDTDKLSTEESRVRHKVYNSTEASLLLKVVRVFHEGGLALEKIGVISPYNAQVDYIQRLATKSGFSDLEVHTVDKYQGRDKDCVLISFVRSNPQRQSGHLLADWHRINVAITRAKTKLVLLGSKTTLSSAPILKLLIEKVDRIGGLLELPANALTGPC